MDVRTAVNTQLLANASFDGPNESKEQKPTPPPQQSSPAETDPLQSAFGNLGSTFQHALGGAAGPSNIGDFAKELKSDLDKLGTTIGKISSSQQDGKKDQPPCTHTDFKKSNDGANDNDEPTTPPPSSAGQSTIGQITNAVKEAFGQAANAVAGSSEAETKSSVKDTTDSGSEVGADAVEKPAEGAKSPGHTSLDAVLGQTATHQCSRVEEEHAAFNGTS